MRRPLAALLAGVLLLATGALGWRAVLARYDRPGPLPAAQAIVVPHGTIDQVAGALQSAGAIEGAISFRLAAFATSGQGAPHAAELQFPAHASLRVVLDVLRTGRPVQHRLTIPEGLTAAQIALLLDRTPALVGDTSVLVEGAALPETYAFERGATRAALVERAAAAMTRALAQVWQQRDEDLPLTGARDLLTLASIVERETARPEERPLVAAVFLNRLRRGMKLQSDPTVAYGVTGGSGVLDRPLSRADLDWPTPYNTYRIAGLPPCPIASPGMASLLAVAHPARTDDLYFVTDGHGGHAFARTLEDHNRNVARWRSQTESQLR